MFPYRYLTWRFCLSLLWLPPPIIFNYRLICYLRVGNVLKDIKHFILSHFSSIFGFYGVISATAESLDHFFFSHIFMFSLLCFLRLCLQELLSRVYFISLSKILFVAFVPKYTTLGNPIFKMQHLLISMFSLNFFHQ